MLRRWHDGFDKMQDYPAEFPREAFNRLLDERHFADQGYAIEQEQRVDRQHWLTCPNSRRISEYGSNCRTKGVR
jgi:hypothetical protein